MTCAKKVVTCIIVAASGRKFYGDNACANPQAVCPRWPFDDYTKCIEICRQEDHAEIMALKHAKHHARGARAYTQGITYVCRNCQEALFDAGVISISIGDPPA